MTQLAPLSIRSHRGEYQVHFGPLFQDLEKLASQKTHFIVDDRVAELYAKELAPILKVPGQVLRIQAIEENKSMEEMPRYMKFLIERGVKRNHQLVAIGGGIIQDITAFIAGTLLRGVSWSFYPTTLLAQADSCIGSKSSINVGKYKNQVGTYTPPQEIRISVDVLKTLTEPEIRSGVGEIIKIHLLAGEAQVAALQKEFHHLNLHHPEVLTRFIRQSLELKKGWIEKDEFDQNERLLLNYGHTFGHAIESATNFAIPHGIAVTLGMEMSNAISTHLGFVPQKWMEEVRPLLRKNSAGFRSTPIPMNEFLPAIRRDKKNSSTELALILTRGSGRMFRHMVALDDKLQAAFETFLASLKEE
jgi:3-dehydroquinate synthase